MQSRVTDRVVPHSVKHSEGASECTEEAKGTKPEHPRLLGPPVESGRQWNLGCTEKNERARKQPSPYRKGCERRRAQGEQCQGRLGVIDETAVGVALRSLRVAEMQIDSPIAVVSLRTQVAREPSGVVVGDSRGRVEVHDVTRRVDLERQLGVFGAG